MEEEIEVQQNKVYKPIWNEVKDGSYLGH